MVLVISHLKNAAKVVKRLETRGHKMQDFLESNGCLEKQKGLDELEILDFLDPLDSLDFLDFLDFLEGLEGLGVTNIKDPGA